MRGSVGVHVLHAIQNTDANPSHLFRIEFRRSQATVKSLTVKPFHDHRRLWLIEAWDADLFDTVDRHDVRVQARLTIALAC